MKYQVLFSLKNDKKKKQTKKNSRMSSTILVSALTLLLLNMTCPVLANSLDPDQLASTDLDLHC